MKLFRIALLNSIILQVVGTAELPSQRVWTDAATQRTLEATILQVLPDSVKLKLKNGSTVTLTDGQLIQSDRDYLATLRKESPKLADAKTPAPPTDKWPTIVALKDVPEVTVVKEDEAGKEFIYQSPHYEFHSPALLGASVVREFARIFETTYQANWALPLGYKPAPEEGHERFQCMLYKTKEDYFDAGGMAGSAGVYSGKDRQIMVPLESLGVKFFGKRVALDRNGDNDTLIHEITHQMMNAWLGKLPVWFIEGSAEYVRMAKYDHGKMSFVNREKNLQGFLQDRGSDGKSWTMTPLKYLMSMDHRTWAEAMGGSGKSANRNYGSAGVLVYYFYHCDDKGDAAHTRDFLKALSDRDDTSNLKAVTQHLLRDFTYAQLQEAVEKALRKEGVKITWADG